MRSSICGAVGLAAVGLLILAPVGASAQRAENGLLGNKLWNRHSDVLRRHGQPTRIEIGAVTGGVQQPGAAGGAGVMSGPAGPGPMMSGGGSPYGGGGMAGSGSPYGGGGIGAAMGQMMANRYGSGGGRMAGGLPGMGGMPGMEGGSGPMPGMSGMPGMSPGGPVRGGMMSPGAPGGGGTSGETEDGEITWVYEKGPLTNLFLFNKDGRLIQVSSFGYAGGGAVTSRGVRLGDPLGKVYAAYGWTGKIAKDAQRGTMTLDFSKDNHVAFQVAERGKGYRVVGITVGITELGQLLSMAGPGDFSGARAAGGSMGIGRPGMSGPGGMPGSGMMRPGGLGGKLGGGGGSAAGAEN